MLQMIASDMDGTLLNSNLVVTDENAVTIKQAQEKGVHFLVATGRSHTEAKPALEKAGIYCPMITLNGAQAFDADGNNLFTIAFSKETVKKIVSTLENSGLPFELATTNGFYSVNREARLASVKNMMKIHHPEYSDEQLAIETPKFLAQFPVNFIDSYDQLLNDADIDILKFITFSYDDDDTSLKNIEKELGSLEDIAVTSSFKGNLELTHVEAQKGIALTKYADKLNIQLENVMALGDNLNDLSMLRVVGYSVAMANAEVETKETARFMTETNDNSGVSQAILRFMPN